jgi:hypothetical protein
MGSQADVLDDLLRCVLLNLYCNHFLPEEEQHVMTMLDELLRLQIAASKERADYFLRGNSAFQRMVVLHVSRFAVLSTVSSLCAHRACALRPCTVALAGRFQDADSGLILGRLISFFWVWVRAGGGFAATAATILLGEGSS